MIRSVRIHRTGGPDALRVDTVDLPAPLPGQARMRVLASGVNFIDTYHRSGLYALPRLPHGIGVEAAGVVEAVASDVSSVRVGDRVACAGGPPGTYAETYCIAADRLVRIPDGIDFETAAASMLQGMTAEYLVDRCAKVEAGDSVLVHAAAGGTGQLLLAWLRDRGARAIGVVGSRAKVDVARAAGASDVIVRSQEDVVSRVRGLTGGVGVRVVFDSVGRDTTTMSLDCLARRGMLVSFGNASGPPAAIDPLELSRRGSLYLTRPILGDYIATRDELVASSEAVFDRIARGVLCPIIDARFPLEQAALAHEKLEARGTLGKILLLP